MGGGGYSASGGDASSGIGDTSQSTGTTFGGFNYSNGINTTHLMLAGLAALLILTVVKKK
ncbi:hypothetical protein [Aestuariibacter sp. A3R04]|uniref:hypothetical protein n=1 Tax=Aestuariibacter sp. A3R04 TaxID=2841571 RepID=UPI001C088D03|nr:hypothetical protein [Aestuariibacter sp. A3R04]MBU3022876.1 hypothetical protein [Aestuariibacter sp. A3R04]